MVGQGAACTAITILEFGLRGSKERRGFNWMCASLSGVLEKWGEQTEKGREVWMGGALGNAWVFLWEPAHSLFRWEKNRGSSISWLNEFKALGL